MQKIFILLSVFVCGICAQRRLSPQTICPDYFIYVYEGGKYYGLINLDRLENGRTDIEVSFTQRGRLQSEYVGDIEPYLEGEAQMYSRPALYWVNFPEPQNPPKLTKLVINNFEYCSASNYPPPSTWFTLSYTVNVHRSGRPRWVLNRTPYRFGASSTSDSSETSVQSEPPRRFIIESDPVIVNVDNPFLPSNTPATPRVGENYDQVCGQEGAILRPLVHGGKELARGQFPWMAALYRKKGTQNISYFCGGSLISARTVISAAHCFNGLNASQVVVFLGRYNLELYSEDGAVIRDIADLLVHPDYKQVPDADVAVLQLSAAVSFSDFIRPICLFTDETTSMELATVAGWGSNELGESFSKRPKRVDINIIGEAQCLHSSPGIAELLTKRTLCAGKRDKTGPCMGDSGSGLVQQINSYWLLRGVVSYGQTERGQCKLDEYVIYADLTKFSEWLSSNTL